MLFNSFDFLLFFPIVCIIYYLLMKANFRNLFLLIASYYFYMNWKPVYAVLLLSSTIITYVCGLYLEKLTETFKRKLLLSICLILNFGILFTFKYYNFINESIFDILSTLGLAWNVPNLDIMLPVGISFYTFMAAGYMIDVYRGTIKAERNFFTYALFVSFFPQLAAGPIGRAKNLLQQFNSEHQFEYQNIAEGFKQMVWGYFMKLCVADILCQYVDAVYNNIPNHNGTSILLAAILFTFQIYCDFAGYSNIAIGTARIMGYNLMENFKRPYLSLSMKEFWKRWHISLSSWFMDYLYIPLGGSRVKYGRHMLNLFITFLVSGLWHGSNWTFIAWGCVHGIFLIIENIFKKYIYNPKQDTAVSKLFSIVICFSLVTFAWIFFRANTITDAITIIDKIFTQPGILFINPSALIYGLVALIILITKDIVDHFEINFSFFHSKYLPIRYISIVFMISYIILFGTLDGGQFIYFQF